MHFRQECNPESCKTDGNVNTLRKCGENTKRAGAYMHPALFVFSPVLPIIPWGFSYPQIPCPVTYRGKFHGTHRKNQEESY